ncbi:serine/threonine-protein kinase [Actinomyces bowdenii]|uniref:non-specific serine/threonine protein kinase n=1 Tax=Actinomyces bowdenii TaxID=131109 RepID=A0A853EH17_9ACTO|nr:serine/threonine-protein kinase [Actinomyces bowdenii]MBF0696406.1 protein kinase [Actinomyces bowdenii]NYS68579.1 protein kinase [Actinomyces bowdenii]
MTAPPPPTLSPSEVPPVPGVRLEGVLGRGGFATVYAGEQLSLARPVAVKIDSRMLHDERNRRRFHREMSAASRVSGHPHAVSLIDAGVLRDGRPYLVMERCDGGSLVDLLRQGPLTPAHAVRIIEAVCGALGAAHRAGVLHRDIKPGNILIDAYGAPRLGDFGIAAIEREDRAASVTLDTLTPEFAPPEAFTLSAPAASGDVWSMGAVLFSLVTGRSPRTSRDGGAMSLSEIVSTLHAPVDTSDPRIPGPLRLVLDRAMHPDPAQRHRDGTELAQALTALRGGLDSSAAAGREAVLLAATSASQHLAEPPSAAPPPDRWSPTGPAGPGANRSASRSTAMSTQATAGVLILGTIVGSVVIAAGILGIRTLLHSQQASVATSAAPTSTPAPATATAQDPAGTAAQAVGEAVPEEAPTPGAPTGALPAPARVDEQGIPVSESMPWPVGTCLNHSDSPLGGTTVQQTDCAQAQWVVFAGGDMDPASSATSVARALEEDPQVQAICTAAYAERYGLDLGTSHEISTVGPSQEEWAAGQRGFSCVYGRI